MWRNKSVGTWTTLNWDKLNSEVDLEVYNNLDEGTNNLDTSNIHEVGTLTQIRYEKRIE